MEASKGPVDTGDLGSGNYGGNNVSATSHGGGGGNGGNTKPSPSPSGVDTTKDTPYKFQIQVWT